MILLDEIKTICKVFELIHVSGLDIPLLHIIVSAFGLLYK